MNKTYPRCGRSNKDVKAPIPILIHILRYLTTFAILGFIITQINATNLISILQATDLVYFFLALAVSFFYIYFISAQTKVLLKATKVNYNFLHVLKINLLSYFFSFINGFVGGVIRWSHFSGASNRRGEALYVVVVERFHHLCAAFIFLLAGFFISLKDIKLVATTKYFEYGFVVLSIILGGVMYLSFSFKFVAYLKKFIEGKKRVNNLIAEKVLDVARVWGNSLINKKYLGYSLISSVVCTFLAGWIASILAVSLAIDLNLMLFLWLVSLVSILQTLPITAMGLGIREGTLVFLLPKFGVTIEQAVGLAVLMYLITIIHAFLGGITYLYELLKKHDVGIKSH